MTHSTGSTASGIEQAYMHAMTILITIIIVIIIKNLDLKLLLCDLGECSYTL